MDIIKATQDVARAKDLEDEAKDLESLGAHYRQLFQSEGSDAVLIDLAQITGFYEALPDGATEAQLREHNAKRSVFERILNMADLNAHRAAALRHMAVAIMQKMKSGR